MTIQGLNFIASALNEAGINYEFGQWSSDPVPEPYFVGEYSEEEPFTESGEQTSTFILTGTAREWILLEQAKATIENLFSKVTGKAAILPDGNGIAAWYASAYIIPTGDAELKRIQINLTVKEWSVN